MERFFLRAWKLMWLLCGIFDRVLLRFFFMDTFSVVSMGSKKEYYWRDTTFNLSLNLIIGGTCFAASKQFSSRQNEVTCFVQIIFSLLCVLFKISSGSFAKWVGSYLKFQTSNWKLIFASNIFHSILIWRFLFQPNSMKLQISIQK